MDQQELVAFARASAAAGVDLYDLLGVDGTTSREDIHRAWRRKGLQYHPDKAGADYDASLYERFAHARDVLVDEEARKVYDTGRAAAARRQLAGEQMSAERRRFKDELEAAERAHGAATAAAAATGGAGPRDGTAGSRDTPFGAPAPTAATAASERDKLREAARRRADERQRREQAAQDKVRQRDDDRIAELEQRLRAKEDKARRRADKKRGDDASPAAAAQPPSPRADAEWRQLLKTGAAEARAAGMSTVQQRPLYGYTLGRLKAAGAAQRQRAADEAVAATSDDKDERRTAPAVAPFEALWADVDDPDVRTFITRVPRFTPAAAAPMRTGDTAMDMTG